MSFECDICGKVLDKEQNFKSHIESVHKGKKTYECVICEKVFDEEQTSKAILNQFTRERNIGSMALNQFGYFII